MRILITGGAGFVGSSLARSYKTELPSCEVVAFDNLRRRGSELNVAAFKERGIRFVHGDIRCPSDLHDLDGNFDLLIEASAEPSVLAGLNGGSPAYTIDTNLTGTGHCLEYARRRAGGLIFLSTSRVYSIAPLRAIALAETAARFEIAREQKLPGITEKGISEDFATHLPRSLYGATKLASELLLQEYVNQYGMKAVVNRCGVLAGAGQFGKTDQGVFTLWVAHHHFNRGLKYTGFGGTGKQVRDLLHPDDLYSLIRKQQSRLEKHAGEIFNVGGGAGGSTSLLELTELCRKVTGNAVAIGSDPATTAVDIPLYVSDHSRASQAFDWKPGRDVAAIVRDIGDWIKTNEKPLRGVLCQ